MIDSMLSEHRNRAAARRFLRRLVDVAGRRPLRVTTDHHGSYPKAIRWICGRRALHRRDRYLNNRTEQSHRPLKQRYYAMLGFGNFDSASRFCTAFDEVHNYFRMASSTSPTQRRGLFMSRWRELIADLSAA
jgi:transposase-like protein